jgi:hydrogenase expression/formation protein HypE
VGIKEGNHELGMAQIRPGDVILVSGPVGDHGTAVMLAREQFGLRGDLRSDAANIYPLCAALYALPGLRFLRDPTRGGLATVAHEIARASGLDARLQQPAIPVNGAVQTVCEMLGYDPLFLACEGRVVAVVAAEAAVRALATWRGLAQSKDAALIGRLETGQGRVILETELGGERLLDELEDDPLPRIC